MKCTLWSCGQVCLALAILLMTPTLGFAEHADVFRGQVAMDTNPQGEIVVALDITSGESGSDGIADHLFILQQDLPFKFPTAALASAEVVFKDRQLVVRSLDSSEAWILFTPVGEAVQRAEQLTRAVARLKGPAGYESSRP